MSIKAELQMKAVDVIFPLVPRPEQLPPAQHTALAPVLERLRVGEPCVRARAVSLIREKLLELGYDLVPTHTHTHAHTRAR